jgi:hypothetical protein
MINTTAASLITSFFNDTSRDCLQNIANSFHTDMADLPRFHSTFIQVVIFPITLEFKNLVLQSPSELYYLNMEAKF